MKKLYSNALVWQEDTFVKLDILIENGVIAALEDRITSGYTDSVDWAGALIIPACIDMHVHVGEKTCGLELSDNWQSLSRLAEKVGIAAIGAFITETGGSNKKQKTLIEQYKKTKVMAVHEFTRPVHWHLTPTVSEPQDIIPLLMDDCDLKFYTTYKPSGLYKSYAELSRWMNDLQDFKPRMLVHCEDDDIVTAKSAQNPFRHSFDHTLRRPEEAEVKAVEKVLDLAVQHNYPVHIVHVSVPKSSMLIREAQKSAPVTCETAPHYLLLNEQYLQKQNGHRWLCTPPLRSEATRGLLVEMLPDGYFDVIATDHCPYMKSDKDKHQDTPEQVPMGIAGLGATLTLLYENFVKTGKLSWEKLIPMLTTNPAKLMHLYPKYGAIQIGSQADLLLIKPDDGSLKKPVISSLSDTYNPYQDFTHPLNYSHIEVSNDRTDG